MSIERAVSDLVESVYPHIVTSNWDIGYAAGLRRGFAEGAKWRGENPEWTPIGRPPPRNQCVVFLKKNYGRGELPLAARIGMLIRRDGEDLVEIGWETFAPGEISHWTYLPPAVGISGG